MSKPIAILALCLAAAFPGNGYTQSDPASRVADAFSASLGLRTWFSTGQTAKTLYDIGGSAAVSRLSYNGLDAGAVEGFGELGLDRAFLKGNVGIGGIRNGSLRDEDFEPFTFPYSSTDSDQHDGDLDYATIDLGLYLFDSERAKLGGFVGYNWLHQTVNAFGCEQMASSFICNPSIPTSVLAITQENNWRSLRLGLNWEVALGEHWALSGEGAWLPRVSLDGSDTHWLRICPDFGCFTGPLPEDGNGDGYQFEGLIEYRPTERVSLGLGGRYWHMETSGDTHFEGRVLGFDTSPQPVDWLVDIYGILAQAKVRF